MQSDSMEPLKISPFLDFFFFPGEIFRFWPSLFQEQALSQPSYFFDMDSLPLCCGKVQLLASENGGCKFETECRIWYLELELQHSLPCNSGSSNISVFC